MECLLSYPHVYGRPPPLAASFFLCLVQHLASWAALTWKKPLQSHPQEKERARRQQSGNVSARADVPTPCGGRSHNPRRPQSQMLLAAMAAILLLPSAVFFGALRQVFFFFLSWHKGLLGSFGNIQVPLSYQRSRTREGEGGQALPPKAS